MPDSQRASLRLVWESVRPYRATVALCCAVTLVSAALEGLAYALVASSADAFLHARAIAVGGGIGAWIGRSIHRAAVLALCLQLARAFANLISFTLASHTATRAESGVRQRVYERVLAMPYLSSRRHQVGDWVDLAARSLYVRNAFLAGNALLSQGLMCVAYLAVLFTSSPRWLGLAFLSLLPGLLAQRLLARRLRRTTADLEQSTTDLHRRSIDLLSHLRALHAFDQQGKAEAELAAKVNRHGERSHRQCFWFGASLCTTEAVLIAGLGVFGALALGRLPDERSVALLAVFTAILYRFLLKLQQFLGSAMSLTTHAIPLERLVALLADDSAVPPTESERAATLHSRLELNGISFRYPGAEREALRAIHFSIAPGERVALVGPSGAGKSTLVDLLLGLHPPTTGRIEVDGVPLAEISRASWLREVATSTQDAPLFHDSLEGNVRFGRTATRPDALGEAVRVTGLRAVLEKLPRQEHTVVGDGGHALSHGERQRVSLARALYLSPRLLILDEALNALDIESQRAVMDALLADDQKTACLFVTHDLTDLPDFDRVYFMEAGEIVESGTHQALLAERGHYWRHWSLQRIEAFPPQSSLVAPTAPC